MFTSSEEEEACLLRKLSCLCYQLMLNENTILSYTIISLYINTVYHNTCSFQQI
jgi:hypothetical protein